MVNTTILSSQFYIELNESGHHLRADEIMSMYRYMHNQTVSKLRSWNMVDRFGRLMDTSSATVKQISEITGTESLTDALIYAVIVDDGESPLPAWTKLYPRFLLELPIRWIATKIENWHPEYLISFISNEESVIRLDLTEIVMNDIGMVAVTDIGKGVRRLVIGTKNCYENKVTVNVESNSYVMWNALGMISGQWMDSPVIVIHHHNTKMSADNKLLCTILLDRKENAG